MSGNYTETLSADDVSLKKAFNQQTQVQAGTTTLSNPHADGHEVLLLIGDRIERLLMTSGREYQLGCFEAPHSHQISLSDYGARQHGISRLHAYLLIQDNKLYIADHGSTNGTYVASQRLSPDEPVALRKGSQILLGRLRLQVLFQ